MVDIDPPPKFSIGKALAGAAAAVAGAIGLAALVLRGLGTAPGVLTERTQLDRFPEIPLSVEICLHDPQPTARMLGGFLATFEAAARAGLTEDVQDHVRIEVVAFEPGSNRFRIALRWVGDRIKLTEARKRVCWGAIAAAGAALNPAAADFGEAMASVPSYTEQKAAEVWEEGVTFADYMRRVMVTGEYRALHKHMQEMANNGTRLTILSTVGSRATMDSEGTKFALPSPTYVLQMGLLAESGYHIYLGLTGIIDIVGGTRIIRARRKDGTTVDLKLSGKASAVFQPGTMVNVAANVRFENGNPVEVEDYSFI